MEITKQQYKKALEEGKIYITTNNNACTQFNIYYLHCNIMNKITNKCNGWSNKLYCYKCNSSGTNRILDIILSIGYSLGLEFGKIKQNWKELN